MKCHVHKGLLYRPVGYVLSWLDCAKVFPDPNDRNAHFAGRLDRGVHDFCGYTKRLVGRDRLMILRDSGHKDAGDLLELEQSFAPVIKLGGKEPKSLK